MNLVMGFRHPVTSLPLSLTFPYSTLRQNPKHHFRSYLIDASKAFESTALPNEVRWIIDTMSVIQSCQLSKLKKHTKNGLRQL